MEYYGKCQYKKRSLSCSSVGEFPYLLFLVYVHFQVKHIADIGSHGHTFLKSLSSFVSIAGLKESSEILPQHEVFNYFACIKSFDHLEIEVLLIIVVAK